MARMELKDERTLEEHIHDEFVLPMEASIHIRNAARTKGTEEA